MSFQVRTEPRPPVRGLDGSVLVLESTGQAAVEIWPAFGFNCYRWQTVRVGRPLELLYSEPQHFLDGRPTRCGIPILFPFPNRIRDGRFRWAGKEYQLPLNDSVGQNAIHGYACRTPWRVVDRGANAGSAWATGEFQASVDAPESVSFWPADYRIRVTYRLTAPGLRVEAVVDNPDRVDLPFGLGYHPYYRIPWDPAEKTADYRVQAAARRYWELHESLPTGATVAVDAGRDLQSARPFDQLNLDDVLTDLANAGPANAEGLLLRGMVGSADGLVLQLWTSPAFRELVAFTPPHRQAVCLEPYTCPTDAINLQQRGTDAGLLVLQPGATWSAVVEMLLDR